MRTQTLFTTNKKEEEAEKINKAARNLDVLALQTLLESGATTSEKNIFIHAASSAAQAGALEQGKQILALLAQYGYVSSPEKLANHLRSYLD